MEDKKIMTEEERTAALRESLLEEIPDDVKEKIANVCSDVALCKILAENGIDLEKLEKKIADAGFDANKLGLQLPDSELDGVSGGFYDSKLEGEVKCDCGNDNRDEFSKQLWVSWISTKRFFRCKKCNRYIVIYGKRAWGCVDDNGYAQEMRDL